MGVPELPPGYPHGFPLTWEEHGGQQLRGLQQADDGPLESLAAAGLQVAVKQRVGSGGAGLRGAGLGGAVSPSCMRTTIPQDPCPRTGTGLLLHRPERDVHSCPAPQAHVGVFTPLCCTQQDRLCKEGTSGVPRGTPKGNPFQP